MNGGRQGPSLSTLCIVSLSLLFGCGRERTSGATAAADSSQISAGDTSAAATRDTAVSPARDTTVRPAPAESTARGQPDNNATATTGPTPKKTRPKPAAPRPAAPKPAAPAPAASTETGAAAAPSGDTTPAEPTAEASAPLRDQYHTAPLDTVSQQVYNGWKQFNLNCARCHGEDVQGTTIAPHLIVSLRPDGPINTKELFIQTVCAGRPAKGMPSWCALGMEMPTIEAIYSYVKGRSEAQIHPGRPAVKAGG
jgi:cbb3-type cytochrome c oxidase subunit III